MALHEQCIGATDEWYTPPAVFDALGVEFDLDVAHPGLDVVNWIPARKVYSAGGLEHDWTGFIWMNPPFGSRNGIEPWLARFFEHGNGVALVPDRTSAPWWHRYASRADALLFVGRPDPPKGQPNKIKFIDGNGRAGASPAQGTTLLAAGGRGVQALMNARRAGFGLLCWRAA